MYDGIREPSCWQSPSQKELTKPRKCMFAGTYLVKTIATKFPLIIPVWPTNSHKVCQACLKTNYADDGIMRFGLDPKIYHFFLSFLYMTSICLFVHGLVLVFILFTLPHQISSCLSLLVRGQHSSFCQVLCSCFSVLFILFTFLCQSRKWLIFQDGNSYPTAYFSSRKKKKTFLWQIAIFLWPTYLTNRTDNYVIVTKLYHK